MDFVIEVQKLVQQQVVTPNWKDFEVSWMMSDPDDWLPRSCLPLAFQPAKNVDNTNSFNLNIDIPSTSEPLLPSATSPYSPIRPMDNSLFSPSTSNNKLSQPSKEED